MTRDEISEQQIAKLRRVFEREVQEIRDAAKLVELQRLIEANDTDGIIKLLGINRAGFSDLELTISEAFRTGGVFTAADITPVPVPDVGDVLFRFDMAQQASVSWIESNAADFVVEIVEQQRQMIRDVMAYNVANGINPRRAALDLVGRKSSTTGKRVGGFIGMTNRQAESVLNAREQLQKLDSDYFNRKLRDKRFDSTIRRAINDGEPLSQNQVDAAISSLQNRTVKYRGDMIARTEAINALRAGESMAIAQAVELGEVEPSDVTKEWDSSADSRVRVDHNLLDGQKQNLLNPFTVPMGGESAGQQLMYPSDTSLGATGTMTIACRCRAIYRIDFIGKASRSFKGFR